jgi:hypothetical protein
MDQALRWPSDKPGTDHIYIFGGDLNDYDPSDGSFNCNGVIAADRSLHPHAYEVRYQYRNIHARLVGGTRVEVYNENTGQKQQIMMNKKDVAIIENPLYAVMNEPNSTLRRLIRKLNLLDAVDEQSSAGKLDLIIQLPYTIRTDARRKQAEDRRKDIENQLAGSKYGIAYADATEHITQLNRPVENNLMNQVQYLTSMLYSQLGLTENIFNGTADEQTLLNYYNSTVEPIMSAITDEFKRKFLTKTARTQHQSIMFFRDPFKLVPINNIAEIADKFTRNEILTSNEIRGIIGFKPSDDPKADQLINSNLNQSNEEINEQHGNMENEALPTE